MEKFNNTYKLLFFLTLFSFCGNSFSQNLFVTKLSDLEFGDVFIGTVNVDVPHTDARAAKFSFYHTRNGNRTMTVTFTLPNNLVFGVNNLPITFDQAHSAWLNNDQVGGRNNFDPWVGFTTGRSVANEVKYVWLGANIASTTGYPSGLYTGTIVLTVEF